MDEKNFLFLLSKLENISFFPILIWEEDQLIFPTRFADQSSQPLLSDNTLQDFICQHQGIIHDPVFSDIFFAVDHVEKFLCIVGPCCLYSCGQQQKERFLRAHGIPREKQAQIQPASHSQLIDTLSLIGFLINGVAVQNYKTYNVSQNHKDTSSSEAYYNLQKYVLDTAEKEIPHFSFELEFRVLQAFVTSDREEFEHLFQQMSSYSGGEFAATSLKFKEYSLVTFVTVFTRAAIQSGVSPNDAYSLSDTLLYSASQCRREEDYYSLYKKAIDSFFSLVQREKNFHEQSLYVRKCKVYIEHHLNQELSPEILANHLGISKNYLLSIFSKEEELTLVQYILRSRIEAAANMLKYSDFEIIDIAFYFHFRTQSHFGTVFKKYMGMSPSAYRKSFKPAGF